MVFKIEHYMLLIVHVRGFNSHVDFNLSKVTLGRFFLQDFWWNKYASNTNHKKNGRWTINITTMRISGRCSSFNWFKVAKSSCWCFLFKQICCCRWLLYILFIKLWEFTWREGAGRDADTLPAFIPLYNRVRMFSNHCPCSPWSLLTPSLSNKLKV